eukprot:7457938-Pyramimonas_sp.AAC.1
MAAPRVNDLGPRMLHLQGRRRPLAVLVFLKETEMTMHRTCATLAPRLSRAGVIHLCVHLLNWKEMMPLLPS